MHTRFRHNLDEEQGAKQDQLEEQGFDSLFATLRTQGYEEETYESLRVLIPILRKISEHDFLQDVLTLHGGFLLAFSNLDERTSPRLTNDLDFTGDTRGNPDTKMKTIEYVQEVLQEQGIQFRTDTIRSNIYKITILHAFQKNREGIGIDLFFSSTPKLLKGNETGTIVFPGMDSTVTMKMQQREEAIAEKIVTLILRAKPRDILDVWFLTRAPFDSTKVRKCILVTALCDMSESIERKAIDVCLKESLCVPDIKKRVSEDTWSMIQNKDEELRKEVGVLVGDILGCITSEEREALDVFYHSEPVQEANKMILEVLAKDIVRDVVNRIDATGLLVDAVREHEGLISSYLKRNTTYFPKRKRKGRER